MTSLVIQNQFFPKHFGSVTKLLEMYCDQQSKQIYCLGHKPTQAEQISHSHQCVQTGPAQPI
jgi:hypothetical protein